MSTYEKEIEIIDGTIGKTVNLQAQDEDGAAVPLTGCTVKWVIFKEGASKSVRNVTCTEVDLALGKVSYTLLATDWGDNKLQPLPNDETYTSSLIADKTDFHEEFPSLLVKITKKAPT